MSTTAPHRRGKPLNKPEPTLLESPPTQTAPPSSNVAAAPVVASAAVVIEDGSAPTGVVVKRATVHRAFVGTGPFDRHWLNLDCCGLFCACATYMLHAYAIYAVCFLLIPPWFSIADSDTNADPTKPRQLSWAGVAHCTAFSTLAALAVISHFTAMTTNPGAVPPDAKPLPELEEIVEDETGFTPPAKKLCRRCRTFKPPRAHHCSVCRRCIVKMDHHCPWVNNCVGIGNHKYFLLFVFYTMLSCVYSMVLIIARFMTCSSTSRSIHLHGHLIRHFTCLDRPTQLVNILGLMIEAVLFGMFTSCMIMDQWDVIFSKLTHIDRMKSRGSLPSAIGTSTLAGVTEVFGTGKRGDDTRFRLDWLSPFARVTYPASCHDQVMGFCRSSAAVAPVAAACAKACCSAPTSGGAPKDPLMQPLNRSDIV